MWDIYLPSYFKGSCYIFNIRNFITWKFVRVTSKTPLALWSYSVLHPNSTIACKLVMSYYLYLVTESDKFNERKSLHLLQKSDITAAGTLKVTKSLRAPIMPCGSISTAPRITQCNDILQHPNTNKSSLETNVVVIKTCHRVFDKGLRI